ncbi:WSSV401 [White spot syndrome virus]|uniref:WSSV401 n=1 Tax=White spot syndrome virus TaxID=342409 RepID=A0A2I6SC83_9VIRU|nr:WSSV401 [White spot syndrome virus]
MFFHGGGGGCDGLNEVWYSHYIHVALLKGEGGERVAIKQYLRPETPGPEMAIRYFLYFWSYYISGVI